MLSASQQSLVDCMDFVTSFKPEKASGQSTMKFPKRVRWSLSGKRKMASFRQKIHNYMVILGLIQQNMNRYPFAHLYGVAGAFDSTSHREALLDLNGRVQRGTENLSMEIRRGMEEVKLQISPAIDEPWDQKPIRFQDAIGRRFPVPLEVCRTFKAG